MEELLIHPLFLLLIGSVVSALVTYFSQRLNRATFKPLFEKHAKRLFECEKQHLKLIDEIGADQVVIVKASNSGKMPSVKNGWKINTVRCYEIVENGQAAEIIADWQSQSMETEYWEMIIELMHKKVVYYPADKFVKSKRLRDALALYGIKSFILSQYFFRKRFLFWGKTEIYYACWGYKNNHSFLDPQGNLPPNISIPMQNRRKKLAQFFMR